MSSDKSNAEQVDLGTCCACGGTQGVRNVIMLNKKAPILGRGWGCMVCNLPLDGAIAVLCDDCLDGQAKIRFACQGYPAADGRIPIDELSGLHEHDEDKHLRFESAKLLSGTNLLASPN